MKLIPFLMSAAVLLVFPLTSCTTARDTAEGATDIAGHAVEKTGHAVVHGERKLERHL